MEARKCVICGKEFAPIRGNQICCSPPCSRKLYLQRTAEKLAARRKPVEYRECEFCGKTFQTYRSHQRFCSRECYDLYQSKSIADAYRKEHGLIQQEKECEACGKKFMTLRTDKKYCSKACHDKVIYRKIEEDRRANAVLKAEGKPTKTMVDWEREARECNLDYGTYRGLIAAGKTYDQLKAMFADKSTPAHSRASKGSRASTDCGYGRKLG